MEKVNVSPFPDKETKPPETTSAFTKSNNTNHLKIERTRYLIALAGKCLIFETILDLGNCLKKYLKIEIASMDKVRAIALIKIDAVLMRSFVKAREVGNRADVHPSMLLVQP